MALSSTRTLTEMSNKSISLAVNYGQCVGLTLSPSCADCLRYPGSLNNILEPSGPVQVFIGLYMNNFTFTFTGEYFSMLEFMTDANQTPDIWCLLLSCRYVSE